MFKLGFGKTRPQGPLRPRPTPSPRPKKLEGLDFDATLLSHADDGPIWFGGWALHSGEIRIGVRFKGTQYTVRVTDFHGTFTRAFEVAQGVQAAVTADIQNLTTKALCDGDVQFRLDNSFSTVTVTQKPIHLNALIGD